MWRIKAITEEFKSIYFLERHFKSSIAKSIYRAAKGTVKAFVCLISLEIKA